uniref:Uncharacterized protein n=1 Tax=Leersia perrieri TaxID=77586 RepID=A0A0D9XVB3_9ORYZ
MERGDGDGGGEAMDAPATVTVSHGVMGRLLLSLSCSTESFPKGVSKTEIPSFKAVLEVLCRNLVDLAEVKKPSFTAQCWMKEVRDLCYDTEDCFDKIDAHGSKGVGKTTLARSLYRKFGDRFECRAFVRVSRNPDIRRFLISLLSQIKGAHTDVSYGVQDLFQNIKKHLERKRYLVVIDDLWASTTWDIISRAFPRDNGYGARIITITQTDDVADACCSYNSADIFRMKLDPPELLPFKTTIMVAKLLQCNFTVEQQNSLLSSLGINPTSEGMKELLNLIYGILPHHLKTCLLYFNMYPEDYTIKKDDLVKQWVAEGFIGEVNEENWFKVAEGYLHELIRRGLIQEVDINYNNEVLSCAVHHIVMDFIRYKSNKENFISIGDYFQTTPENPDKVRRLSAQFGGAKGANIPVGSVRMSQLRSLIYFGFFKCVPSVAEYGLLRVLILHVWADKEKKKFDLSSIHELFRLRYLKVACNVRVKLPSKIGRLQYLETLDLDARVVCFPSDINHSQGLLCLRLPCDSKTNMSSEIDKMASVFNLAYFQLSSNSRKNVLDLRKLTKLQDLRLTCSRVQIDRVDDNNGTVESFVIEKFSIFPSLPQWIGELGRLCILKIAVRDLPRNNIEILKRLTALTVLSLSVQTTPAERVVFDKGFDELRYFKFTCTAPYLSFVEGTMVKVERFKLCFNADCKEQNDQLASVNFQYLTSLKEISVKFRDPSSSNIETAKGVLDYAVSKHPNKLILSKEPKEEIVYIVSAQELNPRVAERQDTTAETQIPVGEVIEVEELWTHRTALSLSLLSGSRGMSGQSSRNVGPCPAKLISNQEKWELEAMKNKIKYLEESLKILESGVADLTYYSRGKSQELKDLKENIKKVLE